MYGAPDSFSVTFRDYRICCLPAFFQSIIVIKEQVMNLHFKIIYYFLPYNACSSRKQMFRSRYCGLTIFSNQTRESPAVLFPEVGRNLSIYMFLDTKTISFSSMWATAKQVTQNRHLLRHNIWSKIRVVGLKGYPKMIIWDGRLFCFRWCSDMFIGCKKSYFTQHMSDGKSGGPIEKGTFWDLIFDLNLELWVI